MIVAGVDGYAGGWVASLVREGSLVDVRIYPSFGRLLSDLPDAGVIAVDVPIGLPGREYRAADLEARRWVGRRRSSVFLTPPRIVLSAPTYREALDISRRLLGRGLSAQAYHFGKKVLEVDPLVAPGDHVIEIHPEVSFRAMAGRELRHSKHRPEGRRWRYELLRSAGLDVPRDTGAGWAVPEHDLLDSAAAAWSARRVALGEARSLPDPPEIDELGRQVAIWY